MALDFPTPSTTGEIHNENGYRFVWDGSKWQSQQASSAYNLQIVTGNTKAEVVDTGSDGHFKVTTEGTERLRINSSGNVGIGTTSPKRQLHINGGSEAVKIQLTNTSTGSSTDGDGFQIAIGTNGDAYLEQRENSPLIFTTNNTERLRIDSTGRLCLGTVSSSVLSTFALSSTNAYSTTGNIDNSNVGLKLYNSNGSDGTGASNYIGIQLNVGSGATSSGSLAYVRTADNQGAFVFNQRTGASSYAEAMRIDSSGRLLVGTTSNYAQANADNLVIGDNSSNDESGITLGSDRGSGIRFADSQSDSAGLIEYFHTDNSLRISTANSERMRLTADGKLGIGATSPAAKVEIGGIPNANAVNECFTIDRADGTLLYSINYNQTSNTVEFQGNNKSFAFQNKASQGESMRLANTGHLGIGTDAPSSYYANQLVVDIGSSPQSGISIVSGSSAQGMFAFADGTSGADRYRGFLDYNHSNNSLAFGTGGTERMRLDSSGRLLVRKSASPSAGEGSEAPIFIQGNTTSNSGPAVLALARGQSGVEMANGASLGIITFTDDSGNDYAQIKGACEGSASSTDHPGRITFLITPDGSSNPAERMRISNTGQTFVQGTSTSGAFNVNSTQGAATNKNLIVGGHSSSGITSGTACFVVLTNGNVQNTNLSYGQISDVKLKENIVDANSQWDDIKRVQVRNYNFKEETGHQTHTQIGVVAQELETVSPGLVYETPDIDDEGNELGTVTKAVSYSVLYMKAVKALQEAMTRIETLEAKVAALEAE